MVASTANQTKRQVQTLAKVTAPRLARDVYERKRLTGWLDETARQHPLIWIEGPPGAGKTTLALSWLASAKRPCVWYQVDAGDSDLATFFHYLGLAARQAAPRIRRPMPHLTPEYLGGIEIFARRFFEEFAHRLEPGTVIVFDNFQDAGDDASLHGMLSAAFDQLPDTIEVLCISRGAPPPAFARLRANGMLAHLDREQMRLTLDETRGVAALRTAPDAGTVAAIHGQTLGWAAGLVLMLEQQNTGASPATAHDPQTLFDYFAGEILRRLDDATRAFLMQSALLPKMRIPDVEALTGLATGGRVLADLTRRNYFTYRLSPSEAIYEYHPLFRTFLLARARQAFAPMQWTQLQAKAAGLLAVAGQIEAAAELSCDAGDWSALSHLILTHAGHFIAQGRSRIVMEWLDHMPVEALDGDGWLLYWSGLCRLAMQPDASRRDFERAYARFEERDDPVGLYLSWAGILDTYVFEWGDFRPIDRWITVLESLRERYPVFPSAEIEARVAGGMFNALVWRQPWHPNLAAWEARVMSIIFSDMPVALRTMLGGAVALYHIWMGDIAKVGVVIEATRSSVADPLTRLHWYVMAAMHAWFSAEHNKCLAVVAEGLQLAEDTGVHLLDIYLSAQAVYSSVAAGQLATAEEYLGRISQMPIQRLMDKSLYHYQSSSVAWLRNDLQHANEHSRIAIDLAAQTGAALPEALCRVEFASSLFVQRNFEEGNKQLDHALALGRGVNSGPFERSRASGKGMNLIDFMGRIAEANGALQQGETGRAMELLRDAMTRGARQGYVNYARWHAPTMSRLCALALEHGIEPDYVRKLIKVRNLAPPESAANLDAWPWPIRIFTLGRFEIVRDGKPVEFSGKVQKPLELLKALIALGGADVGYEQLSAVLWPDAEGDKAYHSLGIALHRLRKLMGDEIAIQRQGNRVSLNPQCCWCDALAFEQAVDEVLDPRSSPEMFLRLKERAVGLYRGNFLAGDLEKIWSIALRERLSNKYLRLIRNAGEALERSGQLEHAIEHYHKALDVNQTAEEFYQSLMECYHRLGRKAEALSVYNQCRLVLSAAIGLPPSAKTESIYRTLIATSQ